MTSKIQSFEAENIRVKKSQVRLVVSGDYAELYEYQYPFFYNWRASEKSRILDKDDEYHRDEFSLFRSRTAIRRLIMANESAWGCVPKFVTYTFRDNVKSLLEANIYWKEYIRRMRLKYGPVEYLVVPEFQKRGAVHYHCIFFNLPFIVDIKEIFFMMWGHGFITVRGLQSVRHIGAYVSKYLTKTIIDERLKGQKTYFTSSGLLRPYEVVDKSAIADIFSGVILKEVMPENIYKGRYGIVKIKQFKIQNNVSNKKQSYFSESRKAQFYGFGRQECAVF